MSFVGDRPRAAHRVSLSSVGSLAAPDEWSALPDPAPLLDGGAPWRRWLGPAIAIAMLGAVAWQFGDLDWRGIARMLPVAPLFWMLFAARYLALPFSEWLIFRRLWTLPAGAFLALVRKQVSNELLLGYLGEAYFYGWMRRHAALVGAPFGAIKDVAILSATVGNAVTLALLAASWSVLGSLHLGLGAHAMTLSFAVVALSSVVTLAFRRTLFSLPRRDLWFVAALHLARTFAIVGLSAAMWHFVLPGVALSWWLLLATLRMLVSRLPFVPNKDLVFAGLAIFLIGRDAEVANLMTLVAGLILATHLILGAVLGVAEVATLRRRSCA